MNTRECLKCNNSTVDDSDKAHITITCHIKGKQFCYGQYVECSMKNNSGKRNKDE